MTPATATDGIYCALLRMAEAAPVVTAAEPMGSNGRPMSEQDVPGSGSPQPAAGESDPLATDRAICESIGLDVLGEQPGREIVVFSQRKTDRIVKISQLKYADLLQIAGPVVKERVHVGPDGPPGSHHFERVKEAVALLAGQQRLRDTTIRGAGVWPGDGGRLVLVGRGEAAVWSPADKSIERAEKPKAAGLLLDLDTSPRWYDHAELAGHLAAAENAIWRQDAVDELHGILSLWRWKTPGAASLLTGLVLATWVQTAWRWRPHVALTGESSAGKSSFLIALAGIFGKMAHLKGKPSEAGLRQTLGNRAAAVLIDELEAGRHRKQVLELLRTSSTGIRIPRGTMGQGGAEYGLQHLCWISAIELGIDRQPDANRYLIMEMLPPTARGREEYRRLPTDDALTALGRRLLAVAVWACRDAMALADRLKTREIVGHDPRGVESLTVPAAMLGVATALSEGAAGEMLDWLAGQVEREPGREPDHAQLVHAILGSTVSLEKGQQATVAQLLTCTTGGFSETFGPLERVGIAMVADDNSRREFAEDKTGVFFDHKTVLRYLLKDTDWASQQIDTLLLRLESAKRSRRRLGGRNVRGIEFDWATFAGRFLDTSEGENSETEQVDV